MNSNCIEQKGQKKKAVNFEEAMTKAFSEIFHNLKEIEADGKKQRERVNHQRRRQSAPASVIREVTETLKKPETESNKNKVTTRPASSMSTMHWILDCHEEEEDVEEDVGLDDLSLSFLHNVIKENQKTAPK